MGSKRLVSQLHNVRIEVKVPLLYIILDCLRQNEVEAHPWSSPLELQWSSGISSQCTTPERQRSSSSSSSLLLLHQNEVEGSSPLELQWLLGVPSRRTTPEGQRSSNKPPSSNKTKLKLVHGRHLLSSSSYRTSPLSVRPLRVKGPSTTPPPPTKRS